MHSIHQADTPQNTLLLLQHLERLVADGKQQRMGNNACSNGYGG